MDLRRDIEKRTLEKLAGIMDAAKNAWGGMTGSGGTLSPLGFGAGGAMLGGLAGSRLGSPGMLGGAALGGLMGFGGANAVNQQMGMQNSADTALMGGIGAGLVANDMMDSQQSMALQEQGQIIDSIINFLSGSQPMEQPDMGQPTAENSPEMNGIGQAYPKREQ